jgi:hypothetical protein
MATSLATNITAPNAPQIDILVTNGAGAVGTTALATVQVSWDAAVMSFDGVVAPTARVTVGSSWCTWTDYGIPFGNPAGKVFKLRLYRKSGIADPTNVVATATDAGAGDFASVVWPVPVPPGYPEEP